MSDFDDVQFRIVYDLISPNRLSLLHTVQVLGFCFVPFQIFFVPALGNISSGAHALKQFIHLGLQKKSKTEKTF